MDPLKLALQHILLADKLLEAIKERCEDKELNFHGVTTRIKNFPSLMMDAGIVPAMTFYLSKVESEESSLKKLYEYFNMECDIPPIDCNSKIVEDASKKESAGYTIASAMLLSALSQLVGVKFGNNDSDFMKDVVNKLKELIESHDKRFELDYKMGAYGIELKKLIEAFSKTKWEVEEE